MGHEVYVSGTVRLSNEGWLNMQRSATDAGAAVDPLLERLLDHAEYDEATELLSFSFETREGTVEELCRQLTEVKDRDGVDEVRVSGDNLEEYGAYFIDQGVCVWVGYEEIGWALAAIGAERLRVAKEKHEAEKPVTPPYLPAPDQEVPP